MAKIEAAEVKLTEIITREFGTHVSFDREELLELIARNNPRLKPSTWKWLIYDLKRKNLITQLGKDKFSVQQKPAYHPCITIEMSELSALICKAFHGTVWCIWNTMWFNEFSNHQFTKEILVAEIEKEVSSSLFYFLQEHVSENVFLNPDTETLELYSKSRSIVIKPLITRTPLQFEEINGKTIPVPRLEKLITDLYCKEPLLDHIQDAEKEYVLSTAYKKYSMNVTVMSSYARRRGQYQTLKSVLQSAIPETKNILDND